MMVSIQYYQRTLAQTQVDSLQAQTYRTYSQVSLVLPHYISLLNRVSSGQGCQMFTHYYMTFLATSVCSECDVDTQPDSTTVSYIISPLHECSRFDLLTYYFKNELRGKIDLKDQIYSENHIFFMMGKQAFFLT